MPSDPGTTSQRSAARPPRPHRWIAPALLAAALVGLLVQLLVSAPPSATAAGCTSAANCVAQMTLDEKIGQMTQVDHTALTTPSDIKTYFLGSLLSGGGGRAERHGRHGRAMGRYV